MKVSLDKRVSKFCASLNRAVRSIQYAAKQYKCAVSDYPIEAQIRFRQIDDKIDKDCITKREFDFDNRFEELVYLFSNLRTYRWSYNENQWLTNITQAAISMAEKGSENEHK